MFNSGASLSNIALYLLNTLKLLTFKAASYFAALSLSSSVGGSIPSLQRCDDLILPKKKSIGSPLPPT